MVDDEMFISTFCGKTINGKSGCWVAIENLGKPLPHHQGMPSYPTSFLSKTVCGYKHNDWGDTKHGKICHWFVACYNCASKAEKLLAEAGYIW